MLKLRRQSPVFVLVSVFLLNAANSGEKKINSTRVSYHDIQRNGNVSIIGNYGLPVGQIINLEGERAKASKTSDAHTLDVQKVNGRVINAEKRNWPSSIQIRNIGELPEGVSISVKGFEVLNWVGTPELNWHIETYFVVTEVVAPKTMEFKEWSW